VGDRSILDRIVNQLRGVSMIDDIVLAVADTPSKEAFKHYASSRGIPVVVGPERDVLRRVIKAGEWADADHIVRVTTENPFIFTDNLSDLIGEHVRVGADLSTTTLLPLGCAAEVVKFDALQRSHQQGSRRHRSELVTSYIYDHKDSFELEIAKPPEVLRRPELRLTVDYPEDLVVVRAVERKLHSNGDWCLHDVIRVLDENPELKKINSNV
jgi:spore coat polysaccharide biosynthesis protein SpsF